MDSYAPLLQKIRLPQPSLQRFAVISIFSKLRSAPKYLDFDSEPGREAISQCLGSASPAVIDQSVRELCRMVVDSYLDISRGLLELQSALDGSDPQFVDVFVKGLGFLVCYGFRKTNGFWNFRSNESHPFVKVLLCRIEVQSQLQQQVLLFMVQNQMLGMVEVCDFLRPFLYYSILRVPFSDSSSSSFVKQLISSMASFCCSFPHLSLPVFKLMTKSLKYYPHRTLNELWILTDLIESIVDAYAVVLKFLVRRGSDQSNEAQSLGIELLEAILSVSTHHPVHVGGYERIVELLKHILSVQSDLRMPYIPKLSSTMLSLFTIIVKSELEHEQLSVLKLILLLLRWKGENEHVDGASTTTCATSEELLFIFPVISLMSSPSNSVKEAAAHLIGVIEKVLVKSCTKSEGKLNAQRLKAQREFPSFSSPGSICFRLFQKLWFQDIQAPFSFTFLDLPVMDRVGGKEMIKDLPRKSWMTQMREYSLWLAKKQKSQQPLFYSQEVYIREMPFLLSSIAGVLVMHQSLGHDAVDSLAAIGIIDPKLGVPLLLSVLFYGNICTRKDFLHHNMSLKILELLPSLASHSAMVPLIIQTLSPMLCNGEKALLYATATRLLCQTWEMNDRSFGTIQGIFQSKKFSEFMSERDICLSLAVSIRDICRKDADRGVDLILSVSECIESKDTTVQALGFQGLAHLCEADVIDFYSAWDVIAKNVRSISADPILSSNMSTLLRWGAMDAEAYPEASKRVVQILWDLSTFICDSNKLQWTTARVSAFKALTHYEVPHLEKNITNYKQKVTKILFSETDSDVLIAMEDFLVNIITYEYINRRRLVKEKKVVESKIEKLLDVFPQVIFSKGKRSHVTEYPGASLICLTPKIGNNQRAFSEIKDEHAGFEKTFIEIAASLPLSRNIFTALLSLESWKSFMGRWMKRAILVCNAKAPTVEATIANEILRRLVRIAGDAIPRSAENVILAIGALCSVLPPASHTVKSSASKFLLDWLLQHEHENRQWPAAISLGLISSCLHVTDHEQKFQNISGLVEVLNDSKSILVKGACGIGLGFSSHNLLARAIITTEESKSTKQTDRVQEIDLLGITLKALTVMIQQLTEPSNAILESLLESFPINTHNRDTKIASKLSHHDGDDLEDDIWGMAGLVLGLGSSVGAIYRAGAYDAVHKIKDLIISWIPHVNSASQSFPSFSEESARVLSVGSSLALPIVLEFCQRVELIDGSELDHLVNGYRELVSELVSVKKSSTFHRNILMASCIGAGNLVHVLKKGVNSLEVDRIKDLLDLFRTCYTKPNHPLIHFGGMLGVVNSMGAGAGIFVQLNPLTQTTISGDQVKLSSSVCEPIFTGRMQEIFLIAQNSDEQQLKQNAAWAVSFMRHRLWTKEYSVDNAKETNDAGSESIYCSFSEDSMIMRLSLWLLNAVKSGTPAHIANVSAVMRCLTRAPRLPNLDWGAIVRRCMRFDDQVSRFLSDSAHKREIIREECLQFSLAHANQFNLLLFLDELSDLPRFRTLEPNLQSWLILHLAELVNVFSSSRIVKLFDDVRNYFFSLPLDQVHGHCDENLMRISCWKGLYNCLDKGALDLVDHIPLVEKCMEVLFLLLPSLQSSANSEASLVYSEWSEAVRCLGKAPRSWLLNMLQVSEVSLSTDNKKLKETLKKIQIMAKLTRVGTLPMSELGRLKSQILNSKSEVIWDVLLEVVAAVHNEEGSVKRQWLVDAVEISCVSSYPSTALQFIGLLSGSSCKYMPLLILDQSEVLIDLPLTLSSLLLESSWKAVVKPVITGLFASAERIYNWYKPNRDDISGLQPVDESEDSIAISTLQVLHATCLFLKDYLPFEKQLKLANMDMAFG